MLTTLKNAFKMKELRKKIFYTFAMLVVIRLGSQLPVPGVDRTYFSRWFAAQTGDAFNFFDAFTGGSFLNMSLFALNITPYITSSIIIQLLTIAIPKLEEMQKDGEDGRKKLTAITRYVTVGLALIESTAMAVDSIRARPTVTYLVIAVSFLRPSSPSFCISSSFGMAIVKSCIMMEDVIYGVMFSANNDMFRKEPPVNASKKLNASPVCAANHLEK